ncbi:MAG: hypothetical protein K0Q55_2345 [Verrucomicrobia bacterium]|jgi:hypothetical protein|nr:hypothetical protein [Verrucomicrobiota bacterium]
MPSNQTTCNRCGTVILQRTADENHGQCLPCRRTKDGYDFDRKNSEWRKPVTDSLLCCIPGTLDEINPAANHLAEQILPRSREYVAQGMKFLDEFAFESKLAGNKWCAVSICFPCGDHRFEISYEGPDYEHYLWTVVFSENSHCTENPYWPTEARRNLH